MDKSWMDLNDRVMSSQYAEGVEQFLTLARSHVVGSDSIWCQCRSCYNNIFLPISEVETHLFINGINPNYKYWIFHWEEEILNVSDDHDGASPSYEDEYIDDIEQMLDDIRECTFMDAPSDCTNPGAQPPITKPTPTLSFEKLLDNACRPLFEGYKKFSKLSFIVKLLHIKTIGGWSIKSFDLLLDLLRFAFPEAQLPHSYEESRSLEWELGFNYHKIHACPNDCVLLWNDNAGMNEFPKCKAPRWLSNTRRNLVSRSVTSDLVLLF